MITLRASVNRILLCRRSVIALVAIVACGALGAHLGEDTSGAIAAIAIGIAGANAYQGSKKQEVQPGE